MHSETIKVISVVNNSMHRIQFHFATTAYSILNCFTAISFSYQWASMLPTYEATSWERELLFPLQDIILMKDTYLCWYLCCCDRDRTQGNSMELHHRRVRGVIGKGYLAEGGGHGTAPPSSRHSPKCGSLGSILKMLSDIGSEFRVVLCRARGWTQWSLQVSSNLGYSMIQCLLRNITYLCLQWPWWTDSMILWLCI